MIGVSSDTEQIQRDFAASMGAPFPMIGDKTRHIGKLYGVLWPLLGVDQRVTFVIDKEGIVRGVFHHELQIAKHLDDVLHTLRKLQGSTA